MMTIIITIVEGIEGVGGDIEVVVHTNIQFRRVLVPLLNNNNNNNINEKRGIR